MKGVIYKYISPSNKVYIGQTLNEERRKREFLQVNQKYGGLKINNARKKYGPENFQYEILFQKEYDDIEQAIQELNNKEEEFIRKYDSIKNGYNISSGGESLRCVMMDDDCKQRMINSLKDYHKNHNNSFKGKKHSQKTKEILRKKALGRPSAFKGRTHSEESKLKMSLNHPNQNGVNNPFYGKHHNETTKQLIGEKNSKAVVQIDFKTNEILNVFKSGKEAGLFLNKPRGNSEILRVCKGFRIMGNGKKKNINTAYGFKWKYLTDIEGSTTIETDGKTYYRPK